MVMQQNERSSKEGVRNKQGGIQTKYYSQQNKQVQQNQNSNSRISRDLPFDLNDEVYSSEHFRIFEYKVKRCPRARPHDWTMCPFAHPNEKAKRRDPQKFQYIGIPCPEYKKNQNSCNRNDCCPFAHGVFECWLHPAKYKTQMCTDGSACNRKVCFFAHYEHELRQVESKLDNFQKQLDTIFNEDKQNQTDQQYQIQSALNVMTLWKVAQGKVDVSTEYSDMLTQLKQIIQEYTILTNDSIPIDDDKVADDVENKDKINSLILLMTQIIKTNNNKMQSSLDKAKIQTQQQSHVQQANRSSFNGQNNQSNQSNLQKQNNQQNQNNKQNHSNQQNQSQQQSTDKLIQKEAQPLQSNKKNTNKVTLKPSRSQQLILNQLQGVERRIQQGGNLGDPDTYRGIQNMQQQQRKCERRDSQDTNFQITDLNDLDSVIDQLRGQVMDSSQVHQSGKDTLAPFSNTVKTQHENTNNDS